MPQFTNFFGRITPTVHGLVVSSILIPAAVTSCFAGTLSDHYGRPRTLGIGTLIFGAGCSLEAGAKDLGMLFAGRITTGVGEGLFMSTITVYVCEIAPASKRGMLCGIQQFLASFGLCASYFICYGTIRSDKSISLAWRFPFASQSFLAFFYAAIAFFILPHSPVWLEAKSRQAEADLIWEKLGISLAEREKDSRPRQVVEAHDLQPEGLAVTPVPFTRPVAEKAPSVLAMFDPSLLFRTLLGVALMTFQQLTGIDGVLFYAPLLFQAAGLSSSTSSFLASGLSALLMLLITIPAFIYADRWGRRASLRAGGVAICSSMLLIGTLYVAGAVHNDHGFGRWIVVGLIYVFALSFSATWAIGTRIYASEIQPPHTRAPATSLGQSANWAANWIAAFITPILLSKAVYSIYFLFGGCTVFAVLILFSIAPETKDKSFEEIGTEFERSKMKRSHAISTLTRRLIKNRQATNDRLDFALMPREF